jgi:hypothetical protein
MKTKLLILIGFITLIVSNLNSAYLKSGSYLVKYRYINYAVSPNIGKHRYEVLVKNKKVINVLDLKNAKIISKDKAFGLNDLMRILIGDKKNYTLTNKSGKLFIKSKNNPYYAIYIDSIKRVLNTYTLNPLTQREKELKQNYKLWLKRRVKNYTIRIQDSRLKNIYSEGVELTISNGKIVKAKDIRSYKNINPNNKYFLTVKKLFSIAKWGIKNAQICYDIKYGYPNYIKVGKIEIVAYFLKPLHLSK